MVPGSDTATRPMQLLNRSYREGAAHLAYLPVAVSVEPTNHCNLRCPMCPVSQDYRGVQRGYMSAATFDRVVEVLATFRPDVSMNVGGESTLHPHLPEMVRALVDAGMNVSLDSNATLLRPALVERLLDTGLAELVVCLDGVDETSYELMRARASFTRTIANIKGLLAARAARGVLSPRVVVKNIQFWRGGDEALVFPESLRARFTEHPPEEYRATWADHWPGSHRHHLTYDYVAPPVSSDYQPCINLWKHMAISWDGAVYICCLDLRRTTPVGNVMDMPVEAIWNSAAMVEFRRMHTDGRQGELTLCRNCNQIRRPPDDDGMGLEYARQDRFTRWVREIPLRPSTS
jgi:radical SAM protein with 4Fe4S-binding SPASM domain